MRTTELINNGVSIEADAVLGLTARIQRFGGYATDEVALAPEPFDARHHRSGSSRSIWPEKFVPAGHARGSGAQSPRNCRAIGSLTTGVPEGSPKKFGGGVGSGRWCS
jgi:hypothetical protein